MSPDNAKCLLSGNIPIDSEPQNGKNKSIFMAIIPSQTDTSVLKLLLSGFQNFFLNIFYTNILFGKNITEMPAVSILMNNPHSIRNMNQT